MIYFNVNIRHPKWWNRFENIKTWVGKTTWKNKYWEIQIIKNDNLLRVEFEYSIQQDHAGVNLELGLVGYEIHFTVYDNRHWNYEKNCWENYDHAS
jgi:hypothetical protein